MHRCVQFNEYRGVGPYIHGNGSWSLDHRYGHMLRFAIPTKLIVGSTHILERTHMHARTRTHTPPHTHIHIRTYTHACTHAHTHLPHTHARTHTGTHARTQPRNHAPTHTAHSHVRTYARTRARPHARPPARAQTHNHKRAHIT